MRETGLGLPGHPESEQGSELRFRHDPEVTIGAKLKGPSPTPEPHRRSTEGTLGKDPSAQPKRPSRGSTPGKDLDDTVWSQGRPRDPGEFWMSPFSSVPTLSYPGDFTPGLRNRKTGTMGCPRGGGHHLRCLLVILRPLRRPSRGPDDRTPSRLSTTVEAPIDRVGEGRRGRNRDAVPPDLRT